MKLLIIGGTGQLGSALVKDAQSLDYEIISPSKEELNINDESNLWRFLNKKIYDVDIVINTAAFNDTVLCEKTPLDAFRYNSIAVKNMAEICNTLKIPFITFSTDYVFNGLKNKPYIESDVVFPLQIYGLSKYCGEHLSLIYDTTTVIRTSTLYGLNRSKNGKVNFIDKIIEESKKSDNVKVGIDKIVSSTNAEDLSKAVLKLITHSYKMMKVESEKHLKKQTERLFKKITEESKEYLDRLYVSGEVSYNLIMNTKANEELIKEQESIHEHQETESKVYHLVNEGFCSMFDLAKETFDILGINTTLIPTKYDAKSDKIKRPLFSALKNQRAKKLGIELPHWKDALKRYLELKYKDGV